MKIYPAALLLGRMIEGGCIAFDSGNATGIDVKWGQGKGNLAR